MIQRLPRSEEKATTARLTLTGTLPLLWGDTEYQTLKTHLHRTKVILEDAGIGDDLIQPWEDAAWACWRNSVAEAEGQFDPEIGYLVSSELLESYEALEASLHRALREKWRRFRK